MKSLLKAHLPFKPEAYQLLHDGVLALARMEANGMKIDTAYLDRAIKETEQKIAEKREAFRSTKLCKVWKRHYGAKASLDSREQLGRVLFDFMGFKSTSRTKGGGYATDEEALAEVKNQDVKLFLEIQKLVKAKSTYLMGIKKEAVPRGKITLLHPVFNLHFVKTFRSSSDSPNFQNIPVRNEEIKKLVRSAIVARKGRRLVELDFKGVEVVVAACYHKDPRMITYIEDKSKDMHRDMAMELYMLPQKEVGKKIRYCAKNKFVFPQFYGSWYIDCARDLWGAIDQLGLKTESGIPLKEHLKKKGIKKLGACDPDKDPEPGSFEEHVRSVERYFWRKRFPVYAQWKKDWHEAYKKKGWCKSKTGFILQGYMKRNEVINYPVQGSAFHCLLWSLIQIQREIERRGMKTLLIGQIHDSLLADVPENEVQEFITLCDEIMTKKIRKHWPWIIVPLEIEPEVTPIGGNWEQKKEWALINGVWKEKPKNAA